MSGDCFMSRRLIAIVPLFAVLVMVHGAAPAKKTVGDFSLSDPRDQELIRFSELKEKEAVVVVFLGTQCPINNAFLPVLARLHTKYAPRSVQFLGINSNSQDSPAAVTEHAKKNDLPFPVLKDPGNVIADQFGA